MSKLSFVCTSYRRYRCVERIIEQYLQQDYRNAELIILNTDTENPFVLRESLYHSNIIIINNSIDYVTCLPYTNRGSICRDAVSHATGDYFMLADDDDVYLPWHFRQAVEGLIAIGHDSWKPEMSMFAAPNKLELVRNTMEASVIVKMSRIREIGFRTDATGYEGLSWYTKLRDEGQLNEHNPRYIPSYCFNWSDQAELAGHKQSGDINNPNNFENHKLSSRDISDKPLDRCGSLEIAKFYQKYFDFLQANRDKFSHDLWDRYAKSYIG